MAVSVYKWDIGGDYIAYLLDETSDSGFVYRKSDYKRRYSSGNGELDWESGDEPNEPVISERVSQISDGSEYDTLFVRLNRLLSPDYEILGNSENYFNLDNSVCSVPGNGVCPKFYFTYESATTEAESGVEVIASGVTNGVDWYKLKFKIYAPKGDKGDKGADGAQGPAGDTGPQGEKGERGSDGVNGSEGVGRNVMAFLCAPKDAGITADDIIPVGGYYYPFEGRITYPDNASEYEWGDSNECGNADVWMTSGNFDGELQEDSGGSKYLECKGWTAPIRINGEDGDLGKDGNGIQFIFYCPSNEEYTAYGEPKILNQDELPPVTYDGTTQFETKFWNDHPSGIDEGHRIEFMSVRYSSEDASGDTVWTTWSIPAIWAKWGEDGTDGDGVEYIFASGETMSAKDELETKIALLNNLKETDPDIWEQPEIFDWIREQGITAYQPWTDDPSDVSPNEPYEWVSIRRRKWDSITKKSEYGEFCEPKLWAKWARTPITIDLTRESIGIGTEDDWVLNVTDRISVSTTVYAKSVGSDIQNFNISNPAVISGNEAGLTFDTDRTDNEYEITVYLPDGYEFTGDEHSLLIRISATASTLDGETLTESLTFSIFGVKGGKEGEIMTLIPSCGSVIHDLSNDSFIPSVISADVNCETCVVSEAKYCVGDWGENDGNAEDYTIGEDLTINNLINFEGATFIRFKATLNDDAVLNCDVPVIPTGKNAHQIILKVVPDNITCSSDKLTYYESAVTVEAYEIVGTTSTQLSSGRVSYKSYDESNNFIRQSGKIFNTTITALTFDVDELSNNNSEILHRVEFSYNNDGLFGTKTVFVYPMAASLGEADFDDDTWYISTGPGDTTLDTTIEKTSKLNVWYGGEEFTGASVTAIKIMINGNVISGTYIDTTYTAPIENGGISIDYGQLSAVSFTVESGTPFNHAIEILFAVSGQVSTEVAFGDITAKFIIAGLKQGVDGESYHLVVSPSSLSENDIGGFEPDYVEIKVKHTIGKAPVADSTEGNIIYSFYDSGDALLSSGATTLVSAATFDAYTGQTSLKYMKLQYELDNTIVDEETVRVVKDGKNSEKYYITADPKTIVISEDGTYSEDEINVTATHENGDVITTGFTGGTILVKIIGKDGRVWNIIDDKTLENGFYTFNEIKSYPYARYVEFHYTYNNYQRDVEKTEISCSESVNENLLLRTNFNHDNGIGFVQEKWEATSWDNVMISSARTFDGGFNSVMITSGDTGESNWDFSQDFKERIEPDTWYTLSFYSDSENSNKWYTFVHGGNNKRIIADNSKSYVNGIKKSSSIDGEVNGDSYAVNKRNAFTFYSADQMTLNSADYAKVTFRVKANGSPLFVSKIKLEKGRNATAYIQSPLDVKDGEGLAAVYSIETEMDSVKVNLAKTPVPSTIDIKVSKNVNENITYLDDSECQIKVSVIGEDGEAGFVTMVLYDNENAAFRTVLSSYTISGISINWKNAAQIKIEAFSDASNSIANPKVIPVSQDSLGKMLYSAGEWDSGKTYVQTESTIPYVSHENSYYYLNADSSTNQEPGTSGNTEVWRLMTEFDAVITKLLLADYGEIDDAVFYESFMFSKLGRDQSGETSNDFTNFLLYRYENPETDSTEIKKMVNDGNSSAITAYDILSRSLFIPNYFVNFANGEQYGNRIYGASRYIVEKKDLPEDGSVLTGYQDCYFLKGGSVNQSKVFYLTTTVEDIGRRIIVANCDPSFAGYNNQWIEVKVLGDAALIHENGEVFSSVSISNEYIELIGVGTLSTKSFGGWMVVNRGDIRPNSRYGSNFKYLAHLYLRITSGGTTFVIDKDYTQVYDGSPIEQTNPVGETSGETIFISDTGYSDSTVEFTIHTPEKWLPSSNSPGYLGVILTPHWDGNVWVGNQTISSVTICAKNNTTSDIIYLDVLLYNTANLYSQTRAGYISGFDVASKSTNVGSDGGTVDFNVTGYTAASFNAYYSDTTAITVYTDARFTSVRSLSHGVIGVDIPINKSESVISGKVFLTKIENDVETAVTSVTYTQSAATRRIVLKEIELAAHNCRWRATGESNSYEVSWWQNWSVPDPNYVIFKYESTTSGYPSDFTITQPTTHEVTSTDNIERTYISGNKREYSTVNFKVPIKNRSEIRYIWDADGLTGTASETIHFSYKTDLEDFEYGIASLTSTTPKKPSGGGGSITPSPFD